MKVIVEPSEIVIETRTEIITVRPDRKYGYLVAVNTLDCPADVQTQVIE